MEWLTTRMRPRLGWSQWFSILTIGIVVSLFSGMLMPSTPVYAAEVTWSGDTLNIDGKPLKPVTDASRKKLLGFDVKDHVYESVQDNTSHVMQFPASDNPRTATSATYKTYALGSGGPKETSSESTTVTQPSESEMEDLDCDVRGGTGWWMCPISNGLANAIDGIYDWIADLMTTPALSSEDQDSGVKVAWDIMRNIANIAFIIAFIVIIYSQLSNVGVSNYGIKRLVPRVVAAAILVNVSFFICSLIVDISNILGLALQDVFLEIRTQVSANGSFNGAPVPTWSDLTAAILAGSAATIGGLTATAGSLLSGAYFILPVLVGVLLTAVVVFLILAARQALIIILTVISPLAFVCYLLPGTEKFFDKWKSVMLTMMIFFPAFSVVFGGAQLAGMIILQNADSWIMILLSLVVQVMALAIAPLVFKLSGGVLGRFAGIVNDRNRGLIDRTRNWSNERAKMAANRNSLGKKDGELKSYNLARKAGRWLNYRNQTMKNRAEAYQKRANAAHQSSRMNGLADMELRAANEAAGLADAVTANRYEEVKTMRLTPGEDGEGVSAPNIHLNRFNAKSYDALRHQIQDEAQDIAVQGLRKSSIQRVNEHKLATAMKDQEDLRMQAGEVENVYFGNERGSQRAWATARTTLTNANEESIKNASSILNAMNVSNEDMVELANGVSRRNLTVTDDIRTAAIRHILGGKDAVAINNLLHKTDFSQLGDDFAQEYGDALLTNSAKPAWVGGAAAAAIKDNKITANGPDYMRQLILEAVNNNAISAESFVTSDLSYLKTIKEALSDSTFTAQIKPESLEKLQQNIVLAQTDARYSGRIGKTNNTIQDISRTIGVDPARIKTQ